MIISAKYTTKLKQVVLVEYDDGIISNIPTDESVPEYKKVLEWIEEGNSVQDADIDPRDTYTFKRSVAFSQESDPLFFQEQRGEVPVGTWLAKVEEIRARYPSEGTE